MAESPIHSFEDASSADNHQHHRSLTSKSRSDTSHCDEPIKSTDFPAIQFSFIESRASPQASLSLNFNSEDLSIPQAERDEKSKTSITSPLEQRGRSSLRNSPAPKAARRTYASSASPDRFIPKRDFADLSSSPFRVHKHPQQLSPQEKLLRRRRPGHDPFLPNSPPVSSPQEADSTSHQVRQWPHQRPRVLTGPAAIGTHGLNDFLTQVSPGSVWGVGGASATRDPATAETSGVLIPGRHMTAPSYAAKFLPKVPPIDERSQHESRLALALDIDPATRLLGTCTPCVDSSPSPTSSDYERLSPFQWKDSAWKKVEREHCKCAQILIRMHCPGDVLYVYKERS